MLVNSKKLLLESKKNKFAIPATNFIDLNSARTFVRIAEKRKLPLILSFAQSHNNLISLEEAALIGKHLAEEAKITIVLHLDHGSDDDFIRHAIDLGFTSVMIDASEKEFEENIFLSKRVVEYATKNNVTVEAELGHVGANKNYEDHDVIDSIYTEASDVVEFVERTGVDSLAISIGTAHGAYKGTPKINFERLGQINEITEIPLVLHGGSSTGDENLKRCAMSGISKINIFTDFLNGAYTNIEKNKPMNYLDIKYLADEGMAGVLNHYYDVFNTQPIELN